MITDIVCSNGVVLKYDPTIKQGDVVTGYHKGYWKVDVVMPRAGQPPSIYYTKVGGKGSKSCDGSYCRKVIPEVLRAEMINEADRVYAMLKRAENETV